MIYIEVSSFSQKKSQSKYPWLPRRSCLVLENQISAADVTAEDTDTPINTENKIYPTGHSNSSSVSF